jgi:hypothetical protein
MPLGIVVWTRIERNNRARKARKRERGMCMTSVLDTSCTWHRVVPHGWKRDQNMVGLYVNARARSYA